jgi:hypothetical protein
MSQMISPMLQLFREGAKSYQPEIDGLALETGDAPVSLENVHKLIATGRAIQSILVKPIGALVMFSSGEHFYAPGLRVASEGPATEALARIAADAGLGPYEQLLPFYQDLEADYEGQLPGMNPNSLPASMRDALKL